MLIFVCQAHGQPTIVSTTPPNSATGVSPSAAVVFTFSTAMDTTATSAQFLDGSTFAILATSDAWSSGNTVLTCTPTPAFPGGKTIVWDVSGQDQLGNPLGGSTSGFFSTASSSGGGGSGTNKFTAFTVGKVHFFDQYSTAAPVADTNVPYGFIATVTLASNRTANAVTVTLPNSAVSNLMENPIHPELFTVFGSGTNLTTFDTAFSSGNYTFNVSATASNQQVTVNLPAMTQPPAPHVANFTASQSVNATQAFTLNWDTFTGGTATDFVAVTVGPFQTPGFGAAGALNGTATSVVIPANTLSANSNYNASVGFYRAVVITNSTYSTIAYISSVTSFTLSTKGSVTLVMTNGVWSGNQFSFDVTAPASQTITIESSSNLATGLWSPLTTTNVPAGGRVHIPDSHSATNRALYYRARTGT